VALKRDALDAVFSDVIREAYDWTCAYSGLYFPDRKGRDVHASHFYSRTFNSTRWFPDNACCLSAASHDYLGKHPDEHTDFFRRLLGPVRYERLKERKRGIYRYRPADKTAMRKHYAEELERIQGLRARGVTGYIEVVAYD
jgi:hypothetical protein